MLTPQVVECPQFGRFDDLIEPVVAHPLLLSDRLGGGRERAGVDVDEAERQDLLFVFQADGVEDPRRNAEALLGSRGLQEVVAGLALFLSVFEIRRRS